MMLNKYIFFFWSPILFNIFSFVVVYGNLERLQFFWKYLPLKNPSLTKFNDTALHFAAGKGMTEIVRFMTLNLDDHNPESSVSSGVLGRGRTPIQLAASQGHLDSVKILSIQKNLDDPRNNRAGETPLDLARIGNHGEVVDFLLMPPPQMKH